MPASSWAESRGHPQQPSWNHTWGEIWEGGDIPGSVWCSAGSLEVLVVPAHCQDTYQALISLCCWAPFHGIFMVNPKRSHCHWDQVSRWVSISPSYAPSTLRAGPSQGCVPSLAGWPHAAPSTAPTAASLTPSSCRSTLNPSPAAQRLLRLGSWPLSVAVDKGLCCLVPFAAALTLSRAWKEVQIPGKSCLCHACPQVFEGPATASFPPSPGN